MHYRSYLLRLWLTRNGSRRNWRISLQESKSGHLENFTSLEELMAYLQEDINNNPVSAHVEGDSDARWE